MTTLPDPPQPSALSLEFPSTLWRAQQPLTRIHRAVHDPIHFATDQDGRFNPPSEDMGFGTCYLSTYPYGAFAEVFGRFRYIDQAMIDARVVSRVLMTSDMLLADLTHPTLLGTFGITNELSMGNPESTYPIAQRWAAALNASGFSGIYYAARHDLELQSRSIALFGKTEDGDQMPAVTEPLSTHAAELADHYGFRIVSGRPL